jgi:uncharacterized protein YecT (DUF1311 family)
MNITSLLLAVLCSATLHSTAIADGCKNCGLKNRSDDQGCAIEKTPLTRCETLPQFLRGDKELNNAYRKLTKQLDTQSLASLKKTQREWIKWRDEKCDDVEEAANCTNGVCAGVNHDNCIVKLTEKRTGEITGFSNKVLNAQVPPFAFDKTYKE